MFWDSSALVPVLLPEARSIELTSLLGSDGEPVLSWVSPLECQSAIYRRHRETPLPTPLLNQALERLEALFQDADVIVATDEVRKRASRLLALHPIRSSDVLQLAAALVWCEEQPAGEKFVSLDETLREAARREGFTVLPA